MAPKPFPVNHDLASADVNDLVGVIERSTSSVTVGNTAVETTIYAKTIAANSLSIDRTLKLDLGGTFLVNTGGGAILTIRVKFGVTTAIQGIATVGSDDSDFRAFRLEVEVSNRGATNSQLVEAKLFLQTAAITAGTSYGSFDSLAGGYMVGTAAEDTTAAKDLFVTAQWNNANANATLTKQRGLLTLA